MYKVIVEDLTHLGGPMGSEYTTVMDTRMFTTKELALAFITKHLKRYTGRTLLPKPTTHRGDRITWDCGSVGYVLEKTKLDDMTIR